MNNPENLRALAARNRDELKRTKLSTMIIAKMMGGEAEVHARQYEELLTANAEALEACASRVDSEGLRAIEHRVARLEVTVAAQEGWPWCEACQSYHSADPALREALLCRKPVVVGGAT